MCSKSQSDRVEVDGVQDVPLKTFHAEIIDGHLSGSPASKQTLLCIVTVFWIVPLESMLGARTYITLSLTKVTDFKPCSQIRIIKFEKKNDDAL